MVNAVGTKNVNMEFYKVWYAQKCAHEYEAKGNRVVSVSPGLVETEMGAKEVSITEFA